MPVTLAHVVGPILSGAEAVLYTDTDWKIFDQTIASYGRRALDGRDSGKQTREDGLVVYSIVSFQLTSVWTTHRTWEGAAFETAEPERDPAASVRDDFPRAHLDTIANSEFSPDGLINFEVSVDSRGP